MRSQEEIMKKQGGRVLATVSYAFVFVAISIHEATSLTCSHAETACMEIGFQASVGQRIEDVCNMWLEHHKNGTLEMFSRMAPWGIECPCNQTFCPLVMQCIDATTTCNTSLLYDIDFKQGQTPWGSNCSANHYFCPIYRTCIPDLFPCSSEAIATWIEVGNDTLDLFGEPCPLGNTFCLGLMACHNASINCTLDELADFHLGYGSACDAQTEFYCSERRSCLPINSTCVAFSPIGNLTGAEDATGWYAVCENYEKIAPMLLLGAHSCRVLFNSSCDPVCGRVPVETCSCPANEYYCSSSCTCLSSEANCSSASMSRISSTTVSIALASTADKMSSITVSSATGSTAYTGISSSPFSTFIYQSSASFLPTASPSSSVPADFSAPQTSVSTMTELLSSTLSPSSLSNSPASLSSISSGWPSSMVIPLLSSIVTASSSFRETTSPSWALTSLSSASINSAQLTSVSSASISSFSASLSSVSVVTSSVLSTLIPPSSSVSVPLTAVSMTTPSPLSTLVSQSSSVLAPLTSAPVMASSPSSLLVSPSSSSIPAQLTSVSSPSASSTSTFSASLSSASVLAASVSTALIPQLSSIPAQLTSVSSPSASSTSTFSASLSSGSVLAASLSSGLIPPSSSAPLSTLIPQSSSVSAPLISVSMVTTSTASSLVPQSSPSIPSQLSSASVQTASLSSTSIPLSSSSNSAQLTSVSSPSASPTSSFSASLSSVSGMTPSLLSTLIPPSSSVSVPLTTVSMMTPSPSSTPIPQSSIVSAPLTSILMVTSSASSLSLPPSSPSIPAQLTSTSTTTASPSLTMIFPSSITIPAALTSASTVIASLSSAPILLSPSSTPGISTSVPIVSSSSSSSMIQTSESLVPASLPSMAISSPSKASGLSSFYLMEVSSSMARALSPSQELSTLRGDTSLTQSVFKQQVSLQSMAASLTATVVQSSALEVSQWSSSSLTYINSTVRASLDPSLSPLIPSIALPSGFLLPSKASALFQSALSSMIMPPPQISCSATGQRNSPGGLLVSSLTNVTKSEKIAISFVYTRGCGTFMINSTLSSWTSIPSDVNATSAYVISENNLFRFQPNACGCHGAVGVEYARLSAGNTGDRVSIVDKQICRIHLLAFPGAETPCPVCKIINPLNFSMEEDSSCSGIKFSDFVAVEGADIKGNIDDGIPDKFTTNLTSEYKDAVSAYAASLQPFLRLSYLDTENGSWKSGLNAASVSDFRGGDLQLGNYMCFQPAGDFNGLVKIRFRCGLSSGPIKYVEAREHEAVVIVNPVQDRPELRRPVYRLSPLPFNFSEISGAGVAVVDMTRATVMHPDGFASGIAVQQSYSTNFGSWQYKCSQSWMTINVTNGVDSTAPYLLLLNSSCFIRFDLTRDAWWSAVDASKGLVYRAWNPSGNLSSVLRQLSIADMSLSASTGVIEQLRIGCRGPGSPGGKYDACGVCGGDNSTCRGCDGVPNSGAKIDTCGNCTGGTTNLTFGFYKDCYGTCGEFFRDSCNFCVRRSTYLRPFKDCAGVCAGSAFNNSCGFCVGGTTGNPITLGRDQCGECGGRNSTCVDCAGVPNGLNRLDLCGQCLLQNSSSWNQCFKLGPPSPNCGFVTGGMNVVIPGAGLSSFSVAVCRLVSGSLLVNVSSATISIDKKSIQLRTPVLPLHGEYSIMCNVGQQTINASSTLAIINLNSMKITSLVPSEAMVTTTLTPVHVVGMNFVNSTSLRCLVLMGMRLRPSIAVEATFVNSTHVRCLVPGSPTSVVYSLSLSYCSSNSFDPSFSADLEWLVDVPVPISVQLTSCSQAVIQFNGLIQAASAPLLCSDLLPTNHTSLGRSSSCVINNFNVVLNLLGGARLTRGDRIFVNLESLEYLNAAATNYPSVSLVALIVEGPKTALVPSVIVNAASVGSCDPYVLSVVNLNGGSLTYSWSVSTTSSLTSDQTAALSNIVVSLRSTSRAVISVAGNASLVNVPLTFQVNVTNCFGSMVTKEINVTKENKEKPLLQIMQPTLSTQVSLQTVVRTKSSLGCIDADQVELKYTWELTPPVSDIVTDRRNLVIPEGRLVAGNKYVATLTVALLQDPSTFSSATAEITVVSLPLRVDIRGRSDIGSMQVLYLMSDVSDPDNSDQTSAYAWNLFTAEGEGVYLNGTPVSLPLNKDVAINSSALQLKAGSQYKVELTVTKDTRTAKAAHSFTVRIGTPPSVVVTPASGAQNPSKKLVVSATLQSMSAVGEYEWSCTKVSGDATYGFIDLESQALGHTSGMYDTSSKTVYLVLKENSMVGGITYRFTITGTDRDGVSSSSFTDVMANKPPTKGLLTVSPSNGTALNTTFTLSVPEGCVDDEGVLFLFGYWTGLGEDRKKVTFAEQASYELQTMLGVGFLEIFVSCVDQGGSFAYSDGVYVNVSSAPVTAQQMQDKQEQMERSIKEGNSEAVAALATQLLLTVKSSQAADAPDSEDVKNFKKTATSSLVDDLPEAQLGRTRINIINSLTLTTIDGTSNFDTSMLLSIVESLASITTPESPARKKRADSGSAVIAYTIAEVENFLDIFSNTIAADKYDSKSMQAKSVFLDSLDSLGASLCRSYTIGEERVLATSDIAILQAYPKDFSDVDTQLVTLGCPSNCTTCGNCPEYMESADYVLLAGLKQSFLATGACVSSAQMPYDLLSSSENGSLVSNVLRITFWSPGTSDELVVSSIPYGVTLKIAVTEVTNRSYICVQWDIDSATWTTTDIKTLTPTGEDVGGVVYVTCNTTKLSYAAILEGPEIVTTTMPPSTTTQVTQPSNTTTAATTATATYAPENYQRKISFKFSTPCSFVFDSNNISAVQAMMKTAMANKLNISESTMVNYTIACGSVSTSWIQTYIGTAMSVQTLSNVLQVSIATGSFVLTLNGITLLPNTTSFTSSAILPVGVTTASPVTTSVAVAATDDSLSPGAVAGIVIGVVVVVVVIIVLIYAVLTGKKSKRSSSVEPNDNIVELRGKPGYNSP